MRRLLGVMGGIGLLASLAGCGGDATLAACFRVCDKEKACMMDDTACRQSCTYAHAGCANQGQLIAASDACLAKDCNTYQACLNDPNRPMCMN